MSWAAVSASRFHHRSVLEVGSSVATAESGLNNYAGGLQALLGNSEEREDLEDAARWFLEDCDHLDVRHTFVCHRVACVVSSCGVLSLA